MLHCLPGDIDTKAVALDHLRTLVAPGGVVFGATILATGADHTRLARKLMAAYNARGIFSNRDDDLGALTRALADRFDRHEVEVAGAVALFAGFT